MAKSLKVKKKKNRPRVLIVDNNKETLNLLKDILERENWEVSLATTLRQTKDKIFLDPSYYDVVMLDVKLPDGLGVELLEEMKNIQGVLPKVIIITGYASLDTAVESLNKGAFAYLQKPFDIDKLKNVVKQALRKHKEEIRKDKLVKKLEYLSIKDPHTGLYNYRYLVEKVIEELKSIGIYSVLMIDIDYFKVINETYGHQYGDKILGEFARLLLNTVRGDDIVIRYGGEEFVNILLNTSKEKAGIVASRIINKIRSYTFDEKDKKINLKVSIGLASFPEDGEDLDKVLSLADKCAREAKDKGGNRIVIYNETLKKEISKEGASILDNVKKKINAIERRMGNVLIEFIYALYRSMGQRDYPKDPYVKYIVSLAEEIGKKFNFSDRKIEMLKHAAVLYDLGKIGIPESILTKRGKLTKKELEIIKQHTKIGADLIKEVYPLKELEKIILYHHERYDGLGYPEGLKGDNIPLGARIIGLLDVYHALISHRPYRKAYSRSKAIEIIKASSGRKFDPQVVNAFLEVVSKRK